MLVKDLICLFGSLDVTQNADNLIVCVLTFLHIPSVRNAKLISFRLEQSSVSWFRVQLD